METFSLLLSKDLSDKDKTIILKLYEDQTKYKILTKGKYALFLSIYKKYLPLPELKYRKEITTYKSSNAKNVRNVIYIPRR